MIIQRVCSNLSIGSGLREHAAITFFDCGGLRDSVAPVVGIGKLGNGAATSCAVGVAEQISMRQRGPFFTGVMCLCESGFAPFGGSPIKRVE